MRKILLTLLLLAAVVPASAQYNHRPRTSVEWGFIAGVNIPDFDSSDVATVKNKLGWQAGIVTAFNLGIVAIEPQILYVRNALNIKPANGGGKKLRLKSNSVDVPLLVSLRALRPFRFYAGPVFTVMNDCKSKSGGDLLEYSRVRPTMSYTAGAALKIPTTNMLVDFRFNGRFRKKELPDNIDIRSYNFALSFGYVF